MKKLCSERRHVHAEGTIINFSREGVRSHQIAPEYLDFRMPNVSLQTYSLLSWESKVPPLCHPPGNKALLRDY